MSGSLIQHLKWVQYSHADLTETQGYAKYSDESTRRAFELFDGKVLDVDFQNLTHKVAHNDGLKN